MRFENHDKNEDVPQFRFANHLPLIAFLYLMGAKLKLSVSGLLGTPHSFIAHELFLRVVELLAVGCWGNLTGRTGR